MPVLPWRVKSGQDGYRPLPPMRSGWNYGESSEQGLQLRESRGLGIPTTISPRLPLQSKITLRPPAGQDRPQQDRNRPPEGQPKAPAKTGIRPHRVRITSNPAIKREACCARILESLESENPPPLPRRASSTEYVFIIPFQRIA